MAARIGATVRQGPEPKSFIIVIGSYEEVGTEQFVRGFIVGYRSAVEATNV